MKNVILIIVTAVITSLIWMVVVKEEQYKHLRAMEKEVTMPTHVMLTDLKETAAKGDYLLLKKKIDLFELKWRQYTERGDKPYLFRDSITNLGAKNSRAGKTE